ncbi:MAG TPA: imidazolonepropionase [Herpetosiphonaceae bacterium]
MEPQTITIDLLLTAERVVTCASPGGPRRGSALADAGVIYQGAVAIDAGRIVAVGPRAELETRYTPRDRFDGGARVLMPGFVDPHTHACYAGNRIEDFQRRIAGATYQELMAAGGGIMQTVRHTRAAPQTALIEQTRARLDRMLRHGTTTVEIKSGYGLDTPAELRMLEVIAHLDATHPCTIVPTFLGAHAVPAEYARQPAAYVDLVVEEMLPTVAAAWRDSDMVHPKKNASAALFCDVFCEPGAFDLAQTRRILERARGLGFALKLHADEFEALGGTSLAVELGATSVDHLVATSQAEVETLAASGVVAVALPGTPIGLGKCQHMPARALINAGGALALASDCNPGTSVCESLPLLLALGCRFLRLQPHEAINATTINAAHALGLGAQVGSLEPGKQADLVLLDLADERELAYRFGVNPVLYVWKHGQRVVDNTLPPLATLSASGGFDAPNTPRHR